MHTAAGSYAGRKAASVNSSGQDEGKQQGFVYAVLVPGGRGEKARGLGAGSEGVPSQGVGGGFRAEGRRYLQTAPAGCLSAPRRLQQLK